MYGERLVTRKEELRMQVDYPSDPHTRLKHAFYRRYIACWMGKVLQGRWAKPGTIIDGFAGSGMYSDGLDGSAIMIAKLFRDHLCRPNFQPLTYVTNDLDPRRCDALDRRMKALPADDRIHHIPVGPKKFEDIVAEVRKQHAPPGTQTMWIIDPYGLKQIPWSTVSEIVKVPKNDAVITFMADEAHRYRTNPAMVSVMNGLYGDRSWQSIPDGLSTAAVQGRARQALLRQARSARVPHLIVRRRRRTPVHPVLADLRNAPSGRARMLELR